MKTLQLVDKEDLKETFREAVLPLIQQIEQKIAKAAIPSQESDLLTRKQAAAYLKITSVTLHAWTKQGIIRCMRICSRVYYSKSELEQVAQLARRA